MDRMVVVPVVIIVAGVLMGWYFVKTEARVDRGKEIAQVMLILAQIGAILVGGWWVYFKFIRVEEPLVGGRLSTNVQAVHCVSTTRIASRTKGVPRFRVDFYLVLRNIGEVPLVVDTFRLDVHKGSLPRGQGSSDYRVFRGEQSPIQWVTLPDLASGATEKDGGPPTGLVNPRQANWVSDSYLLESRMDEVFQFDYKFSLRSGRGDPQAVDSRVGREVVFLAEAQRRDCRQLIPSLTAK